ncbi:hypothetical protein [Mucilaginibacter paludis]|uniref:Uncharacterized protein n=1 Tax=Mucilaginibacter paludis DSM 18603 TaxID=714943 RepID=H1YAK9_9SPHI|nr:hypothetical protein [Mucilaginibacter paludis]EHQ29129.1 hypothetical protein Mucpa_5051 [Mucilaginibacter paludis DSM 18603]
MNKQQKNPASDLLKCERIEREEAEARTRELVEQYREERNLHMKEFEIRVGQTRRLLQLKPASKANTFGIYAADPAADWLDYARDQLFVDSVCEPVCW